MTDKEDASPCGPCLEGGMVIFKREVRAGSPIPRSNTSVWGVQSA